MRRLRSSSIKKLCNTECPVGSPVRASSSSVVEWLVRVHEKYGKVLLDNVSASFSLFFFVGPDASSLEEEEAD